MNKEVTAMLQLLSPDGVIRDRDAVTALGLFGRDIIDGIYAPMIRVRAVARHGEGEGHSNRMALFIGPRGQEAAEIASVYALPPDVPLFLYGRSWGTALARGAPPRAPFDVYYGHPEHAKEFVARSVFPLYMMVGANAAHAAGSAWVSKLLEKRSSPAAAYFGDGAMSEGDLHTALNWSGIFEIPLILFCENNQWAISTPMRLNSPTPTIAERAVGYGIAAEHVDGNDIFAVYAASKRAYDRAVREGKSTLVVLKTYRLGPHSTAVGEICKIPEAEMELAKRNEPLVRTRAFVLSDDARNLYGIEWSEEKDAELREAAFREAKEAAEISYRETMEIVKNGKIFVENLAAANITPRIGKRYAEVPKIRCIPRKIHDVAVRDAIGIAFLDIMRHDPTALYLGQDVGKAGGVMRTTAIREEMARTEKYITSRIAPELLEQNIIHKFLPIHTLFPERIIDSPLDESGIVGVGIGLALGNGETKARVISEIQFSGFVGIAMHQIGEASRMWQRSGGLRETPITILLPYGAGERVEYHNECEHAIFVNNPGLVVVCPSTPQDAYDMMWASVASEKVVLFFWHLGLTREPTTELLRHPRTKPVESFDIRVAREGKHVTVISSGKLVHECLAVADELAAVGISIEVLDLRVLSPLNPEKLFASVRKTGRLVTVQEEQLRYGTGAELVASVTGDHETFVRLQAPTLRLGAPACHMPPLKLYKYCVPQREDIRKAIEETVQFV